MCRIVGYRDFAITNYIHQDIIKKMNDSLVHGGPDDGGECVFEKDGVALGNRRLAIMDLSPLGHQPMYDQKTGMAIVFNGEVYNFKEIRVELEQRGYTFRSSSDTEVALTAFREWGFVEAVKKFHGMFAFGCYNPHTGILTLIRDRFGVKPLYYYYRDGLFSFASETRAFWHHPRAKKDICTNGLSSFLGLGYVHHESSIWQGVTSVRPGSMVHVYPDGQVKEEVYWDTRTLYDADNIRDVSGMSEDALIDELEEICKKALSLRMVSDVPVGVFLSGGIDSSLVTAVLQKQASTPLNTFSVRFDDPAYNEADHAKRIASYLGTNHREILCTAKESIDSIPKLSEMYDEPFGDASALPTSLICRKAREHVTVVLSGDGGDEFFGGYDKYWRYAPAWFMNPSLHVPKVASSVLHKVIPERSYRLHKAIELLSGKHRYDRFVTVGTGFLPHEQHQLGIHPQRVSEWAATVAKRFDDYRHLDSVSSWMLFDACVYLPDDILVKVDRASMHVALETREPLLDQDIVSWITRQQAQTKWSPNVGKRHLRALLSRYLPQEYFDRPKQGFAIPLLSWLRGELKPLVYDVISDSALSKYSLLDKKSVLRFRDDFYKQKHNDAYKMWYLLVLYLWAQRWMGDST